MSNRAKEGDMYCMNAPGFRGHFIILVRVEMPWMYFYDTVDKQYFIAPYNEFKRAQKLIAHSPDDRHKLPYVDFVKSIPDQIWYPLKDYCEKAMRKTAIKHRNFIKKV